MGFWSRCSAALFPKDGQRVVKPAAGDVSITKETAEKTKKKTNPLFVAISSLPQLAAFSQLRFADGRRMAGTHRPVQPLNGRRVYRSGGHVALVSAVLLITSAPVSGALSLLAAGWNHATFVDKYVHWWLSDTRPGMYCRFKVDFVWVNLLYAVCVIRVFFLCFTQYVRYNLNI